MTLAGATEQGQNAYWFGTAGFSEEFIGQEHTRSISTSMGTGKAEATATQNNHDNHEIQKITSTEEMQQILMRTEK